MILVTENDGGFAARNGNAAELGRALQATRARTLGLMDAWVTALPSLRVPLESTLNQPLWEWGHVAWFQEWWIGRNSQRALGLRSDPHFARPPSHLAHADQLFNSSDVAHATRWQLPLPDLAATREYLADVLKDSLALLQAAPHNDNALYFWRLALLHEDMHNEASVCMAQALGLPIPDTLARRIGAIDSTKSSPHQGHTPDTERPQELLVPAQQWRLGSDQTDQRTRAGFVFDNELASHAVPLSAFYIDAAAVTWAQYLPFLEATGYALPPHVRQNSGHWEQCFFGVWQPLAMASAAVHLRFVDAQAWCQWASRRLPTEAEWECAACTQIGFTWGSVWEWTASAFGPYPGFVAHPYTDYSAPWFGTHQVLRGACAATSAHLLSPRFRNFFTPQRNDIFSGFRSVRAP